MCQIGLAAGRLGAALQRSRRVVRALNVFAGTVFGGLAVKLLSTRRTAHPVRPVDLIHACGPSFPPLS
jgi:hypothetical protein